MMLATGLEHAFIGIVVRYGAEPIACYDLNKVLDGYVADGMTYEEAQEFFDFNVIGAWVGDGTPCFLRPLTLTEAEDECSDDADETTLTK